MTLDARRLVRACLVAFVTFLATGGLVIGLVAASGPAADAMSVPAPRPGDRATYEIEEVILDAETARGDLSGFTTASYEWLPEASAMDREFGQRSTHPLRTSYSLGEETYTWETLFDGVTGTPLFSRWQYESSTGDGMHYGVLLEDLIGSEGTTTTEEADWYTGPLGPCGASFPPGKLPKAGAVVDIAGHCDWPVAQPTLPFRAEGWQDGGFLFTAVKDDTLRLWYDGESPFPLRMQVPLADTVSADYTFGRVFRLERIGHERGEHPYPAARVTPGLGPAPTAPRPEWGIPDDGVDHPFPLSQAFQVAWAESDDPAPMPGSGSGPTVSEFAAAHPGTYLAFAAYGEQVDQQGQPHHAWWLLFTDGAEMNGKVVKLEPRGGYGVFAPSQAGLATSVEDWTTLFVEDARGFFPRADRVPGRMPVAQGLLDRHDANGGPAANAYGFIVRCDGDCDAPVAEAVASYAVSDLSSDVTFLAGSFVQRSSLAETTWVSSDGVLVRHYRALGEHDAPVPVVPSAVGSGDDGGRDAVPDVFASSLMAPTTGAAAASLSILGLLAGLLYYFWPSVKGALGVGLFSRIEDGKVLEHPTRRRIHDAIASEPGIHFQALSRKSGVGRGALEHHLGKLAAAGIVTIRRAPGFTCYFLKGAMDRHLLDAAPALRTDGSRAVLQAVAAHPGASSRDLAAALGISPSTASYHLKRLENAGLVAPGDKAGVRLTPLGSQAAA